MSCDRAAACNQSFPDCVMLSRGNARVAKTVSVCTRGGRGGAAKRGGGFCVVSDPMCNGRQPREICHRRRMQRHTQHTKHGMHGTTVHSVPVPSLLILLLLLEPTLSNHKQTKKRVQGYRSLWQPGAQPNTQQPTSSFVVRELLSPLPFRKRFLLLHRCFYLFVCLFCFY